MPKKNLSEATAAALDNLGTNKSEFIEGDELTVVEKVCGDFIERVHNNLRTKDMLVTGKIADLQIQRTATGVEITANKWLVYQDKGVNGAKEKLYDTPYSFKDKKPPVQPFIEWANRRGINAKNNKKYYGKESKFKETNPESIAYAIRESVYQKGMKPRNVYSNEIPKLEEDLVNELGNYFVELILKD